MIYGLSNHSKMECLKAVMSALIDYLKPTIRQYAWMDQKLKYYELGEFVESIQLMKTLHGKACQACFDGPLQYTAA